MNKKQKEEIRQQVVIGIFQWIGYVVFGVIVLGLLSLPFFGVYYAGKSNGYEEAAIDIFEDIWERNQNQNSITFEFIDGRYIELYTEQCPEYCNWKASGSLFTGDVFVSGDEQ